MNKINPSINFCLSVSKFQTILSRHLDAKLGGLGFSELIILFHLNRSADDKMRRIDLADTIGLTASGITRQLLPMEKIGLVKREQDKNDARVSFVALTSAGKTKLNEGLERLEIFCEEVIPDSKTKKLEDLSSLLVELGKNI